MARYTRITHNERLKIKQMLKENYSVSKIARTLRRSKSAISTEIHRKGMTTRNYSPIWAQHDANFQRKLVRKKKKIQGPLEACIQCLLLEKKWSPEQISDFLKISYPLEKELHISTEAIYQHVYRSPFRELYVKTSRLKRKARRKHAKNGIKRGGIRNRVSIHNRDPKIELRDVPGHWEGDLIVGKGNKSAIGTLVERMTRYTIIVSLNSKDSESVVDSFRVKMEKIPEHLKKSLTYDQGTEMAQHERFTESTGIPVYFADPGSPWQRGSNENTNGLVRHFFPKGTDFRTISESELQRVEDLLNTRPRKILGYSTPKNKFIEFSSQS